MNTIDCSLNIIICFLHSNNPSNFHAFLCGHTRQSSKGTCHIKVCALRMQSQNGGSHTFD